MSGSTNDFQNGAPFYLDATQQDLLLAALASNNQDPNDIFSTANNSNNKHNNSQFHYPTDHVDPTFFTSPQQSTPADAFASLGVEESPFADYLDGDTSFDFDKADDAALMIGALPGDTPSDESHEKRKSPDDDGDEEEGGGKRREGGDKQAKKPGRKPLTSEPTTVRLPGTAGTTHGLTDSTEAESSEPGCPARIQRTQGEAPQRPRDKGSRTRKGLGCYQP
jgi:AP-1-like factor